MLTGAYSLSEVSNKLSNEALVTLESDYKEALSLSRQGLTADPSNAFAWAVGGRVLMKEGKNEESQSYFVRSLSLNPILKEGLYWGAEVDILLKDINGAEKKLDTLINLCSDCSESEMLRQSIESFKNEELSVKNIKEENKPNE